MPKPSDGSSVARGPEGADPGLQARLDAQLLLGVLHGALHQAVEGAAAYLPPDRVEALRLAFADLRTVLGATQAALNTGRHDGKLPAAGLAGAQAEPKKAGIIAKAVAFAQTSAQSAFDFVRGLKPVLRWGRTFVGSLARVVPVAEPIGEFIEVVQNSIDDMEEDDASPPKPKG